MDMPDNNNVENKYFKEALSDFTFEMAVGAEIRHLMKLGLDADRILKRLDFPISREKLCEAMEKYAQKQDSEEEHTIIREFDRYGRLTYRKVKKDD